MKLKAVFLLLLINFLISSFLAVSLGINNEGKTSMSHDWHFIAVGDTRNWGENDSNPVRAAVINSVVENNPNSKFILHSGDMVNRGGEQDDWDRYFEDIENATERNVKLYYVIGNHETYTYNLPDGSYGPPETNFSTYMKNVDLPGNERYYSFDFNDQIHFIIINTDEFWEGGDEGTFDITAEQQSWIENDLEKNSIDFVVAVFHRPCYSIRRTSRVEAAQEIRRVLEPILIDYDVDLVFSGHDHYYYRTKRNNIIHVATGGGGAPLAVNGDTSEWLEEDVFFSKYHYCNVTVTQSDENIIVKVDMLIFDETEETTTLGDSFELVNHLSETTLTSPDTEETTTTKGTIPIPLLFGILGIICISFLRKK
jgi:3',5'-cyclic AMP phosphodiesterase CpdA